MGKSGQRSKLTNSMKYLKQPLTYLFWTVLALLMGIAYMWLVLGTNNMPKEGLGYIFHMFYNWGLLHVGAIVGLVIAVLFVLFDAFYLKKKLKQHKNTTAIRFMALFAIAIVVAGIHYVLEKVIDII